MRCKSESRMQFVFISHVVLTLSSTSIVSPPLPAFTRRFIRVLRSSNINRVCSHVFLAFQRHQRACQVRLLLKQIEFLLAVHFPEQADVVQLRRQLVGLRAWAVPGHLGEGAQLGFEALEVSQIVDLVLVDHSDLTHELAQRFFLFCDLRRILVEFFVQLSLMLLHLSIHIFEGVESCILVLSKKSFLLVAFLNLEALLELSPLNAHVVDSLLHRVADIVEVFELVFVLHCGHDQVAAQDRHAELRDLNLLLASKHFLGFLTARWLHAYRAARVWITRRTHQPVGVPLRTVLESCADLSPDEKLSPI